MLSKFKSLPKLGKFTVIIIFLIIFPVTFFLMIGGSLAYLFHKKIGNKKLRYSLMTLVLLPALALNTALAKEIIHPSARPQVAGKTVATASPTLRKAAGIPGMPVATSTPTPTPTIAPKPLATPAPTSTPEPTITPLAKTPIPHVAATPMSTPVPTAIPTPHAVIIPKATPSSQCDPNYSGACVPIASDVDCLGGSGNGPAYVKGPVKVIGRDIYGLDGNGDGIGCEN